MFDAEERASRYRYGSAGWSDAGDLRKAKLLNGAGAYLGHFGRDTLALDADAPLVTICGAGGGKLACVIAGNVCNSRGTPMLVCDPRGEIAALSLHTLARDGEYGFCWGPVPMHGHVHHSCNPLDILTPDSPSLVSDCISIMEGFIPLTGGNAQYFELTARRWLCTLALHRLERRGATSLPDLYALITMIEGDAQAWANELEAMLASRYQEVRTAAAEMLAKQQDAPREFGSVMGEIYAHTIYMADPAVRRSLEGGGFSLSVLTDPARVSKIFLNVAAEHLSLLSPVLRLFFTVAMLYKSRKPAARRVMLLVDEAASSENSRPCFARILSGGALA